MTKFRNRIVHLYWDIDDEFVKKIIEENVEDFYLFRNAILSYLKKMNDKHDINSCYLKTQKSKARRLQKIL